MRVLEIVLSIILLSAIIFFFQKKTRSLRLCEVLAVLLLVFLVFTQGFRWQLLPFVLLFPIFWLQFFRKGTKALTAFAASLFSLAIVLSVLIPHAQWIKPAGPHPVGVMTGFSVIPQRADIYGGLPERSFGFNVFYPASSTKGAKRAEWLEAGNDIVKGITHVANLPQFVLSHLKNTKTYSYREAKPLEGSFPVFLISHGWQGFKNIHIDIAEHMASHGYLVIALDHTYGSLAVPFPDGSVVPIHYPALDSQNMRDSGEILQGEYTADILYSLERLKNPENDTYWEFIHDIANTNAIILAGHSTGGGAVVRALLEGAEAHAAFLLDPWVTPLPFAKHEELLHSPALTILSDGWLTGDNAELISNLMQNRDKQYVVHLNGATHQDLTVLPILGPLPKLVGFMGTLDAKTIQTTIRETALIFANSVVHSRDFSSWLNIDKVFNDLQAFE